MSDAAGRLRTAASDRADAEAAVEDVGEAELQRLRDAYRELEGLMDRYEESATGTGDFGAYVEFQSQVAELVEDLPEEFPEREAFEAVSERFQKRRLSEGDFRAARETLQPARDRVELLADREAAREAYRDARADAVERRDDVDDRIADRERLLELGEADLDAPVERLRDPVETYDEAVRADFREFLAETPAREAMDLLATADVYPLVEFRQPPPDLASYLADTEAGDEPVPTLLEYTEYSASKLDHYVPDAAAFERHVATARTFLADVDADPLTVGWPPPPAERLRWLARELHAVVSRFASEETVAALRAVRDLPRETDYERLRASARARAELDDDERRRLREGAVETELEELRAEREALSAALDETE